MSLSIPALVETNLQQSVVEHPKVNEGRLRWGVNKRGPILPSWGSRDRERVLREYWHHDYNDMFRGAIVSQVKRVQTTPWTVRAPREDGDRWQKVLMAADFGDFDRFVSKLIIDYSRHDQGAFIELIAPGDPRKAPTGAITGLAVLDSARCYPTGTPEYPVIYYDLHSKMHVLHHTRVIQMLDAPDSDENTPGYGDCALSRCIASVRREILMGRYLETLLDDKPPPGVAIFGNLGEEEVEAAIHKMLDDREHDIPGEWGRVLRLYGLHAENKPTAEFASFTKPPENFDFERYTMIDAHKMALGIGMDVQDIWGELTGAGIGTGRQSEILNQKSRGKFFGRLLKFLERAINRAFPENVEFAWEYEDPQEDMEQAQILQLTAGSIQVLGSTLSVDEQRTVLANTVPAIHDVLIDESGNVRKLTDSDPKAANQDIHEDTIANTPPPVTAPPLTVSKAQKDFADTASSFVGDFRSLVRENSGVSAAALRALLRDQLALSGMSAYEDGLRDGGADPTEADAEELARRRRVVGEWNAQQVEYLRSFVDDILNQGLTADQIATRADLWVSKSLRAIYYAGLEDANSELVFPWLLGPTQKHCNTCLSNAGQRHTMKEWIKAGMFPGSSALECEGYQCQCKFGAGVKGPSIGRLPNTRPSLADKLAGWLRGLLGR